MKRLVTVLFVGLVGLHATAEEPSDKSGATGGSSQQAIAILKKVDAATKAVKTVQYHARRTLQGSMVQRSSFMGGSTLEGDILVGPRSKEDVPRLRFTVTMQSPGSKEKKTITVGCDGNEFYLIDPATKTVYADIDQAVVGSDGRMAFSLAMREFTHPTPFNDEIHAEKAEMVGSEKIGGVECYKIHVVYAGGQAEANWWFAKKDFLPRQREQFFQGPNGEKGGWTLSITNLIPNPPLADDAFQIVVPKGFQRTSEFAPNRFPMH